MSTIVDVAGRTIGPGQPAFVIAEAGINHNGDLESARRLVRAAAEAGADAVKFQSFTAETLMTRSAGASSHLDAGAGREDVYSFLDRVALDRAAHEALAAEARHAGIEFMSSALSPEAIEILEAVGARVYKVASMDLDNLPLLRAFAQTGKPIVLSTGMGSMAEVDRAMETIAGAGGDQVVLLHCTSQYPTRSEDANLRAIDAMRAAFGSPVGYSDHTEGNVVSLAAVARGANAIEKHFTLDHTLPGPDQALSAEPKDLRTLVDGIRVVEAALGDGHKRPVAAELEMRKSFRRSIVAAADIAAGTMLTAEALTFKRPGDGISPAELGWVIGRRAKADILADTVIRREDLQ